MVDVMLVDFSARATLINALCSAVDYALGSSHRCTYLNFHKGDCAREITPSLISLTALPIADLPSNARITNSSSRTQILVIASVLHNPPERVKIVRSVFGAPTVFSSESAGCGCSEGFQCPDSFGSSIAESLGKQRKRCVRSWLL